MVQYYESNFFDSIVDKVAINAKLEELRIINDKVDDLIKTQQSTINAIRDGMHETVVMFIDLVDSTKFKIEFADEPEKWIVRLNQFSNIIGQHVLNCKGKIIKYIGDELLCLFDTPTKVEDALNLLQRINYIQENVTKITGHKTSIKISVDYGKVFMLKYEGHEALDPQGTPVDRCARISKYVQAGTILSSYAFVSKCSFPKQWNKLGVVKMKGLDDEAIYQFGDQTIEIIEKSEVSSLKLIELNESVSLLTEKNQKLELDNIHLISTITELQNQVKDLGQNPVIDMDYAEKPEEERRDKDWQIVNNSIKEIQKVIDSSGVPNNEYARFLFLRQSGKGQMYNRYAGVTFNSSIEKDLVTEVSDNFYELNIEKKRNQKVLGLINNANSLLKRYVENYGPLNEDDLFDYTFEDPDFWSDYVGYIVTK